MKKKISKLLVMSLLAFVSLASCGDNPTSSGESSSDSGDVWVENISVTRIDSLIVGDVIDLRDYVTIDGNTNEFTTKVETKLTASIDGYNLRIIGEGEVKVWIYAGDQKQVMKFHAVSETLNKFKNVIKDLQYNFFLAEFSVSNNQYVITGEGNLYNEYYCATYDYDTEASSYAGVIYGVDYARQFTMDDLEGTNYKILPGHYSSLYYEAPEWEVTYDLFSTTYDRDNNYYYLEGGTEAADSILSTLGYVDAETLSDLYKELILENDEYKDYYGVDEDSVFETKVLVDLLEEEDVIIPIISVYIQIDGSTNISIGIDYCLFTDEDYCTLDFVEETIENDEYADPIVPNALFDKVSAITNAKNYTLNIDMGWRNYYTGEVSEEPEGFTEELGDSLYGNVMFPFTASQYVTENKTKLAISDGRYRTYTNSTDGVSLETNMDKDGKITEITTTETSYNGIWEGTTTLPGLINSLNDSAGKDSINVLLDNSANVKDPSTDPYYVINAVGSGADYITSILNLIPFNGEYLIEVYGYEFSAYNDATFAEILNLTSYIYIGDDSLSFDFIIRWSTNISFEMHIDITNIGTTVIE